MPASTGAPRSAQTPSTRRTLRRPVERRVDATDQRGAVEDREHVVAVLALRLRDVHLEPVAEPEQLRGALSVVDEPVERREQDRARRRRPRSRGLTMRPPVTRQAGDADRHRDPVANERSEGGVRAGWHAVEHPSELVAPCDALPAKPSLDDRASDVSWSATEARPAAAVATRGPTRARCPRVRRSRSRRGTRGCRASARRPLPSFQPPVRHGTVERSSRSRERSGPRRRSSRRTYRRNAALAASHSRT